MFEGKKTPTAKQVKERLRKGPYAWPGGYPCYFVTSDGAALCFQCVRDNWRCIYPAIRDRLHDGWNVESVAINYEEPDLICDHCGEQIESAYGPDTEENERQGDCEGQDCCREYRMEIY